MDISNTKLVVLWTIPEDPDAMAAYYDDRHVGLVREIPGLQRFEVSVLRSREYSRMAELHFADMLTLKRAMSSESGLAVAADSREIELTFGVSQVSFIAVTSSEDMSSQNTASQGISAAPVEADRP
jgi:uncharacterized protein (TIGR02118 family)